LLALLFALATPGFAAVESPDFSKVALSARQTLEAMVSLDTTNPPGNEARIADFVAARLTAEGIPYLESEFAPGRKNVIARLKATTPSTLKPVLILAHEDVVTAASQKWASDPHHVTERGGYLYGRGVSDDLGMAAVGLETLVLLKKSGLPLKRDVIFALTGDEESGGEGIRHQISSDFASIDAGLVLNEGGGLELGTDGGVRLVSLQMAEKTYADFTLRATGPTGHSSVPQKGNAIYKLARALDRIGRAEEPPRLLAVTRAYFGARAKLEQGALAEAMGTLAKSKGKLPAAALKVIEADPDLAAKLRTTCVATLVGGGTRVNALPSEATANINCRILPDETAEEVKARLKKVIDDPSVEVEGEALGVAGASPLKGEGPDAIMAVTRELWPNVVIIPSMSGGATDSRWLRAKGIPCYGINPIALREEDARRAHGSDERIPVGSIEPGVQFFYKLLLRVAAGTDHAM
jgi:acetylornithine deacetylase/succinyl-diaminopimelate desuccinylase-like protein